MPPVETIICLVILAAISMGGILWWKSQSGSAEDREKSQSAPEVYTSENVCAGETYHVEHAGEVQSFQVLSVHGSGFFLIRIEPTEGHELDRDHVSPSGWIRELPSNRLIEAKQLLEFLPSELRYAPSYN